MLNAFFFFILLAATFAQPEMKTDQQGMCHCALVDDDKFPLNSTLLILINVPMVDLKESEDCKNMCNYLVMSKISNIPEYVCKISTLMFINMTKLTSDKFLVILGYRNYDHEIKPSVLYQQSHDNYWEYSGVTLGRICCHIGVPIPCMVLKDYSQEFNNPFYKLQLPPSPFKG